MKADSAKKFAELFKKYRFILLVLAAGVILMLLPVSGGAKKTSSAAAQDETFSLADTQSRMETILSRIDGVGQVSVMLTVASGTETAYVTDRSLSYNGSQSDPKDYSLKDETVVVNQGSGYQSALPSGTTYPEYLGAVVVCDGGGDAAVRLAVTQAVSVLTGLGADRITVAKRSN
jgi:stage III sporulation protein AG